MKIGEIGTMNDDIGMDEIDLEVSARDDEQTTEIAVAEPPSLDIPALTGLGIPAYQAVTEFIKQSLVKDIHYGVIKKGQKPSLYQA